MSIAMLEAMATGLPIAVTDVGELADAVVQNTNGIFLIGNDVATDSAKITDLLANKMKMKKMAIKARKTAVEKFSQDAVAAKWDRYFLNMHGGKIFNLSQDMRNDITDVGQAQTAPLKTG
jgi:glycosyltransferase involved in cell wall biosynthesis